MLLGQLLVGPPRPASDEPTCTLWDFSDTSSPLPIARAEVARSQISVVITAPSPSSMRGSKSVCFKQLPNAHYGITAVVLGGWVLQNPLFYGFGGVQAYLPEKDLAIAAEATVEKKATGGVNGGMEVFEEVATELEPNHPPQP